MACSSDAFRCCPLEVRQTLRPVLRSSAVPSGALQYFARGLRSSTALQRCAPAMSSSNAIQADASVLRLTLRSSMLQHCTSTTIYCCTPVLRPQCCATRCAPVLRFTDAIQYCTIVPRPSAVLKFCTRSSLRSCSMVHCYTTIVTGYGCATLLLCSVRPYCAVRASRVLNRCTASVVVNL